MFERRKTINGLEYMYLVRSERQNNLVRQKVVRYLGPIEPIYKKAKRDTRKSNAWLFVRELNEKEEREVKTSLTSEYAFTRDRSRIILCSMDGKQSKQIAEMLKCDQKKVRAAINDFNNRGLSCLQRGKSPGAEEKFTKPIREEILKEFSKSPRDLGYHITTWTLPRFREHLINHKIVDSISIETVRQILMKAGAKLKRSKRWQYSPDKDFHKKNRK